MLDPVLSRIDADIPQAIQRLLALLRIPSISTDRVHASDCEVAADWLVQDLRDMGFASAKHATPGRPMVVGQGGEGERHVLFYGHYDVQPVDPLELWDHPPFEPRLVDAPNGDKHITGRGASDDKGALLTFVEACRAWKAVHGALPVAVSMLFEGEEESGSPSLKPFLEENREELSHDVVFVCGAGRHRRLDPHRRPLQAHPRHGIGDGGLRPLRQPRA